MSLRTDFPALAADVSLFPHPRGTLVRLGRRRSTFLLGPTETAVLRFCDGTRDLAALKLAVGPLMAPPVLEQFLLLVESNGILATDDPLTDSRGQLAQLRLVSVPLGTVFRPGRLNRVLAGLVYGLLPISAVVIAIVLTLSGPELLHQIVTHRFVEPSAIAGYVVSLVVLGVLHECAHAVTIVALGGRVFEVGILLNYFVPAFFVDLSGVSLLPSRAQRVQVWLAGLAAQVTVFAVALSVQVAPGTPAPLREALLGFNAVNLALFALNSLFFIRMDGYFVMEELLGLTFRAAGLPDAAGAPRTSALLRATQLVAGGFVAAYVPVFVGNVALGLALNVLGVPRGVLAALLPWFIGASLALTAVRRAWSAWGRTRGVRPTRREGGRRVALA